VKALSTRKKQNEKETSGWKIFSTLVVWGSGESRAGSAYVLGKRGERLGVPEVCGRVRKKPKGELWGTSKPGEKGTHRKGRGENYPFPKKSSGRQKGSERGV